MSIEFKDDHYTKSVNLYAVFFYIRYAVSYRNLEGILAERGIQVDHATLTRWVVKYSPDIAKAAQMIREGKLSQNGMSPFKPFAAYAG